jgi:crossover junction endodeoxyribonuclease RuvC
VRILAVDQSFTSCGLIVFEDGKMLALHRFVSNKELDNFDRAWEVASAVRGTAAQYKVDRVALEGLAFGGVGDATRNLAGLQYVIVTLLRFEDKLPTMIIPPTNVKKMATGKGNAKKEDLYAALPPDVKEIFEANNYKKTKGLYDMTDAYWIGQAAKTIISSEANS